MARWKHRRCRRPGEPAKPGARPIKKKRVVKKEARPMCWPNARCAALRVPKKRRALPGKEQTKTEITTPKASKRVVRISEGVTVAELARNMGVKAGEIIKKLMDARRDVHAQPGARRRYRHSGRQRVRLQRRECRLRRGIGDRGERAEEVAAANCAAAAGGHRDGPRRPRQNLVARRDPPHQRHRPRSSAASRSISAPTRSRSTGARSLSSIRPATRRSPRCGRAAPRSPTSSSWW